MNFKAKLSNKNRISITLLVGILCVILIIFAFYSYARYMNNYEGNISLNFAKWEISFDDFKLSEKENVFENNLALIPYYNEDIYSGDRISGDLAIVSERKVVPGDKGYFDIVLNPAGTEVSAKYKIEVNLENLPKTINIEKYTINDEEEINTSGDRKIEIEGKILLDDKEKLSNEDIKNIRFYWQWDIEDEEVPKNSSIDTKVSVQQILE